MVSTKSDVIKH